MQRLLGDLVVLLIQGEIRRDPFMTTVLTKYLDGEFNSVMLKTVLELDTVLCLAETIRQERRAGEATGKQVTEMNQGMAIKIRNLLRKLEFYFGAEVGDALRKFAQSLEE